MTSLPLTKQNLKTFMQTYSTMMDSKKQTPTPSIRSRASSQTRSKSKSKSKSRARFSKGKNKVKRAMSAHGKLLRSQVAKSVAPVLELKNKTEKKLALCKSGYFGDSKDSKIDIPSLQRDYDQLCKELQLLRDTMRAGLKDKPIRMRLSTSFVITTTVTTGVTNTVNINASGNGSLDPSKCTEWSALAGLFDEYKCLGGECEFLYHNFLDQTTLTCVSDNIPIMGYDVDQNTPSSSLALTQLSQHKSFSPITGKAVTFMTSPSENTRHKFRWHVPRGTAIYGGSNTLAPGTEWVAVAGVVAAGYIVFYHLGAANTAINTGAGWIYFDLEFRCRA